MVVDDEVAPEPNRVRESVVDLPGVERGFPSIFRIDDSSSTPRLDSMIEKSIERFLITLTARLCRPYLDKFRIVFTDDILIYSQTHRDHDHLLKLLLEMLRNKKFYAMFSKCEFWLKEVYCLGHVINEKGIQVDPAKTEANKICEAPKTPTEHVFDEKELNTRRRRWVELWNDYDCDIRYHLGKDKVVDDALSTKYRKKPLRMLALELAL
ncbi:hypothetical protein QVD17_08450 [Tagetes erecta]|uniref:Reverse transcriptase domain-containing protein n=1 Tax=Tagetes erecta TaxID=13708 RepID=A0AAD8P4L9_TARER|nr:hypothetical protein QVD17_08450 [Tagetes erecta]